MAKIQKGKKYKPLMAKIQKDKLILREKNGM
jgi:hypothetical protein